MSEILNFNSNTSGKPSSRSGESASPPKDARRYSSDEVSDIIRKGLQDINNESNASVDHQEMLSIGQEFGLKEADIDKAYEELLDQRDMEEVVRQSWFGFKMSCILNSFIAVIVLAVYFLVELDTSFYLFPVLPLLITGIVVAAHGLSLRYFPKLVTSMVNLSTDIETGSTASFSTRKLYIRGPMIMYYGGLSGDGLSVEKGLLSLEDDFLVMEYRKVGGIFGQSKSEVKEIKIPLKEIVGVRLERLFWMSKLILQGQRLKTFENVPGESGNSLHLTFYPRSRVAVHNLARDIEAKISPAAE